MARVGLPAGLNRHRLVTGSVILNGIAISGIATTGIATEVSAQPQEVDPGVYLRIGAGLQWPESDRWKDQDCASTQPPALFGCGSGENGHPLGATGSFQQNPVVDAALGYRWNSWLRSEALLNWSPQLNWDGNSNFLGAGSRQPVGAAGSALAGFGVVVVDAPPVLGLRPFIGAGFGLAGTRVGDVTYRFPAIGSDAVTVTRGGTTTSMAYLLTAGVAVPLSERIDLEMSYRWTDFGTVKTPSGSARVVRPQGSTTLRVGGTQVDLATQAVIASLRFRF